MTSIKRSLIKDSNRIRTLLSNRFDELETTKAKVTKDARARGMRFTVQSLSKYLNHGNIASTLSEENIIWLCIRYGIDINLFVGTPKLEDKKLTLKVPAYNEEACINKLKKFGYEEKAEGGSGVAKAKEGAIQPKQRDTKI